MFDAQTMQLQGTGSANPSVVFLSPWFPRGGDYGIFTLDIAKMSSSTDANLSLKVQFIHKNASDTGDGGSPIASFDITIASNAGSYRVSEDVTAGFKELVRYQYTLAYAGTQAITTTMWATFRMLATVWYDKV